MKLKDKVGIVTASAGAGIGQATARKFAKEGALVVVTDHHERRTSEVAESMKAEYGKDRILGIRCDVSSLADVREMVKKTVDTFGRIDILVNNAGRNVLAPVHKMTDEQWNLVIDVNLKGTFFCTKEVVPFMIKQKYGRIISISSIEGWGGSPMGETHYAATKAGIVGFTKALARELAPHNITVNAIAPGIIPNPFLKKIYGPMLEGVAKIVPLGRGGKPEEVANAVSFLASEEASYITGETLVVSGGLYMH
jgi:NAD(P)-dependent dehydrogenase (short-subunit alcohol dehydrogenase family)